MNGCCFGFIFFVLFLTQKLFFALSSHPSPGRIHTSAKTPFIQSCISQRKSNDPEYKRLDMGVIPLECAAVRWQGRNITPGGCGFSTRRNTLEMAAWTSTRWAEIQAAAVTRAQPRWRKHETGAIHWVKRTTRAAGSGQTEAYGQRARPEWIPGTPVCSTAS